MRQFNVGVDEKLYQSMKKAKEVLQYSSMMEVIVAAITVYCLIVSMILKRFKIVFVRADGESINLESLIKDKPHQLKFLDDLLVWEDEPDDNSGIHNGITFIKEGD